MQWYPTPWALWKKENDAEQEEARECQGYVGIL